MNKIRLSLLFLPLALIYACGPQAPSKDEVRAQLIGKYCAENLSLELKDSTYRNTLYRVGPTSGKLFSEHCKGTFELIQTESQWSIKFSKDNSLRRRTIFDCEQEQVIWTKADGYAGEGEALQLKDLFEGALLTKDACSDD